MNLNDFGFKACSFYSWDGGAGLFPVKVERYGGPHEGQHLMHANSPCGKSEDKNFGTVNLGKVIKEALPFTFMPLDRFISESLILGSYCFCHHHLDLGEITNADFLWNTNLPPKFSSCVLEGSESLRCPGCCDYIRANQNQLNKVHVFMESCGTDTVALPLCPWFKRNSWSCACHPGTVCSHLGVSESQEETRSWWYRWNHDQAVCDLPLCSTLGIWKCLRYFQTKEFKGLRINVLPDPFLHPFGNGTWV